MNLIKPQVVQEIEKQCKANKVEQEKHAVVRMKKEIKGLRKLKDSRVHSELEAINHEIQRGPTQENLLQFLQKDFNVQMSENMQEIK